jgi:thiol-disulfide isomerase/thioredoxin
LLIADLWQGLEPEKAMAFRERVLIALEKVVDQAPTPAPLQGYQGAYGYLRSAQQRGVASTEGHEALRKALHFALTDLQMAFYESVCLGGPRPSEMRGVIANEFEKGGFPDEALAAWTEAALVDPTALGRARAMHAKEHPGESFETYWEARLPPAPVLDLRTADGARTGLEALRGHWILLDFWATWCGPCREEMPHLQELQEQLASPQHPPASILTIACDDQPADAYAFVKDRHFTFPVTVLAERGPEDACQTALPTHALVTPGGRLVSIPFDVDYVEALRSYVPEN